MAIKVMGIHHHAVRIDAEKTPAEDIIGFYTNVLNLSCDDGRPDFPGVPGAWIDVAGTAQIHLIGGPTPSPFAKGDDKDPADVHVALGVEDIIETKKELERMGVYYWSLEMGADPEREQIFVQDPSGNMIELHQHDKCRCPVVNRV